ncbi:MAG TPA: AAA family ATPase, partial [Longimicrobiaceae bacterium]|nr:AAA family ATPase [Longimicrobiaceae bacterium]
MKKHLARVRAFLRPRRNRWVLGCLLLALAGGGAYLWLRPSPPHVPEVAYSDLAARLEAKGVRELVVRDDGTRLDAELSAPMAVDGGKASRVTAQMPRGALALDDLERWSAAGTRVSVEPAGANEGPPIGIIALVLLGGVFLFVLFRVQKGVMSRRFGTAPATQLTLSDVGGAREAQADLRDVISFLSDPSRFQALGAQCPKGVLLVGPPGTGKTLLAKAVAGESG